MARGAVTEWHKSGGRGRQTKYEGRKGIISRATRICLERKGIAKTSIADITREVDITRELFYYYYSNKDAAVASVIESYINDARSLLERYLDREGDEASDPLVQVMHALRAWLSLDDDMPVPMLAVLHEANNQIPMMYRVAEEAFDILRGKALLGKDDKLTAQAVHGLIAGLVGAMCTMLSDERPSDEDLAQGVRPLLEAI